MMFKRAVYLAAFLMISLTAGAQINLYIGGNLQGNYSWLRGEEPTFEPGFGGGFSFVYWEHEYWFLKAGIDYNYKTSSVLDYPDDYDVPVISPDDKVTISFTEQSIGIPLTIYFRPYEKGANTLLIAGMMKTNIVVGLKENTEEYGELVLKGTEIKSRMKTNLGIGVGYQRQLDQHTFLNIVPSFNVDLRSVRAYNSVTLTAELIFGIY
ncbi:MAG: outer membrane beta-barrel protein [Bacteroidales bacterium]|nr:outer membrane beta-barrel protein [Bacteroidales bacterium]